MHRKDTCLNHVLACMRRKYWIVKGSTAVKSVLHTCIPCKARSVKPAMQIMADLPSSRVTTGFPFAVTGVDCFGPYWCDKVGKPTSVTDVFFPVSKPVPFTWKWFILYQPIRFLWHCLDSLVVVASLKKYIAINLETLSGLRHNFQASPK